MEQEDNAIESHGLVQLVFDTGSGSDSQSGSDSEEYSLFSSKSTRRKLTPVSEIRYTPRCEVDKWYDRESELEFEGWQRMKNGPNEILFTIEKLYFERDYQRSLSLCSKYIRGLEKQGKLGLKSTVIREILEIAALCCVKLEEYEQAIEYAKLHKKDFKQIILLLKLKNRDSGHFYFRGNVFRECGLVFDSISEYITYLTDRKNDPQVWEYLGKDLLVLHESPQLVLDRLDLNLPKFESSDVTENTLDRTCYFFLILSLGCFLKSLAVLSDCSTWSTQDFAIRRKRLQFDSVLDEISKCIQTVLSVQSSSEAISALGSEKFITVLKAYHKPTDYDSYVFNLDQLALIEKEITNCFDLILTNFGSTKENLDPESILHYSNWTLSNLYLGRGKNFDFDDDQKVDDL
ncbi:hypothetical protein BB560_000640 [Smittium megazygosporum]|uniref:Uncharacterized protein n=1 Tax=Smittium megazygosporum TaxID=133381 RepID=A0A2T9ZJS6_9FUNG|nr:hypothetical protein BB560_000640 [Smittium megazygosporum]